MGDITHGTFERAVARYFEPIARQHRWPFIRTSAQLYEIPSPHFVMRIRFNIGAHAKSINATLIPTKELPGDVEDGGHGELGVAVIAGFNGVPIEYIPWDATEEGLFKEAQHVSNMAQQFALPYLLGQKSDWESIKKFICRKADESVKEVKKYRFPRRVQKRWHLPPPNNEKQ